MIEQAMNIRAKDYAVERYRTVDMRISAWTCSSNVPTPLLASGFPNRLLKNEAPAARTR